MKSSGTSDLGGGGGGGSDRGRKESKKEREESALLDLDALHWGVREEASRAAAAFCMMYPDAAPRVHRQFVNALTNPGSSLPTRYGAIVGLEAQGPRAVRALLLPNLIPAVAALSGDLNLSGGGGGKRLGAALKVRGALLAAAGYCIYLSGVCAPWKSIPGDASAAARAAGGARGAGKGVSGPEEEEQLRIEELPPASTSRQATTTTTTKQPSAKGGGAGKKGGSHGKKAPPRLAKVNNNNKKGAGGGNGRHTGRPNGLLAALRKGSSTTGLHHENGNVGNGKSISKVLTRKNVFGEEKDEEKEKEDEERMRVSEVAAASNWLKSLPPGAMRPVSGAEDDGQFAGIFAKESIPRDNYLAEAWREDFPVEKMQKAMEELFGSDIVPYERNKNKDTGSSVGFGSLGMGGVADLMTI